MVEKKNVCSATHLSRQFLCSKSVEFFMLPSLNSPHNTVVRPFSQDIFEADRLSLLT